MAFERKEIESKKPKTIYWTILRWYWLIIPTIYFLIIVPSLTEGSNTPMLEPGDVFNLIFQMFNYALAGLMTVTAPTERSKSGIADTFLKMVAVQQFLVQNIFGIVLTVLVWYQLPYKVAPETVDPEEAEKWHFQPKTIFILTAVILGLTVLVIGGQFALR